MWRSSRSKSLMNLEKLMPKKSMLTYGSVHSLTLNVHLIPEHDARKDEAIFTKLLSQSGFSQLDPEEDEISMARRLARPRIPLIDVCDRALEYDFNLGACLTDSLGFDGAGVFAQFGSRDSEAPPHLRLHFPHLVGTGREASRAVRKRLQVAFGDSKLFQASRVFVEGFYASFQLKGPTLDDLVIEHRKYGILETVVDSKGNVCGYQFGADVTSSRRGVVRIESNRRRTKDVYYWRQTREIAVRNARPNEKTVPAVEIGVQLGATTGLPEIEEGGPLVGLKLERAGDGKSEPVPLDCWNSRKAWRCIVGDMLKVLPKG